MRHTDATPQFLWPNSIRMGWFAPTNRLPGEARIAA